MKVQIEYNQDKVLGYGFRITSSYAQLLKNGWVRIVINWDADQQYHLFKYVHEASRLWADKERGIELVFNEFPYFSLDVSIFSFKKDGELEPKYIINTKYGVEIMCGPSQFENQKIIKEIPLTIN